MKKILLSGLLIFIPLSANAGILSDFFGNRIYNNAYNDVYRNGYYNGYYNQPMRYDPYYNQRYYSQRYNRNYYYNQSPTIYRTRVRRTSFNNGIQFVSNNSDISKLEKKILNRTYEGDSPKDRIERLEVKLFGTCQSGNLNDRLTLLQNASRNYKAFNGESSFNNNYNAPIFTGTYGSNWRNLVRGNFMNQFAGTPTGITPAMDPAYMDYFEAERALMGHGEDTGYSDNYGYYRSNSDMSTRAGVTILD